MTFFATTTRRRRPTLTSTRRRDDADADARRWVSYRVVVPRRRFGVGGGADDARARAGGLQRRTSPRVLSV